MSVLTDSFESKSMITQQKTLKNSITFSGIGVHSGRKSVLTIHPAAPDAGYIFMRASNQADQFRVGIIVPEAAMHATVYRHNGWMVSTVEHVMAALYALGVSNAIIELDGNEVPILDGSALLFVQAIQADGLVMQDAPKKYLTPREQLTLQDAGGRSLTIDPAGDDYQLHVNYSGDFNHPLVGELSFQGTITESFFAEQLAPARTFGFLEQLPLLRKHNLALGSSLGNTVVIGDEAMNDMRLPNECIRHKVLDLIGDLSLLGMPLIGTVRAHKTSHNFNRLVIEHFVQHPELWYVTSPLESFETLTTFAPLDERQN